MSHACSLRIKYFNSVSAMEHCLAFDSGTCTEVWVYISAL